MTAAARVGVVGGGILGTVLSLRLAQAGHEVTLLERGPSLGGLAGSMDFGGHTVDRFYHVITPADSRMIGLAEEVGLGDQLRFAPVGVGFYRGGRLYDLNGLADFARFPPLSPLARLRLASFVAQCQVRRGYGRLERIPLERWLRRHCGNQVTDRIWRPLLDSRFEGHHSELPATYLWARTRRMSGARTGRERREEMGHVIGGHQRLIDALGARAVESGVDARTDAPVEELVMDGEAVTGVRVGGEDLDFDLTIATLQPPALRFLLPERLQRLLEAYPKRYLGVVCVVLKTRESVLPYYSLNICEPTPITTVVETSHVLGTDHTDGLRLVYLPRYCDPDAPEQTEDDESVFERFVVMLERVSPTFKREQVVDWTVQRSRLVEPVHPVGAEPRVAPLWPGVPGLGLASATQIYPRLLNGDSVVDMAERVAGEAIERLATYAPAVRTT
jgi:protoporphyrinogen oxidase